MARSRPTGDDPLLWRTRRAVERAKGCRAGKDSQRQIRVAAAELQDLIKQLIARSQELDQELDAATLRSDAMTAYGRCLTLSRRRMRA